MRRVFGGIDADVTKLFFRLSPSQREEVFQVYESAYGEGARKYAERAFARWKSGQTRMAGRTLERLIAVVPQVLDFETKVALYRKVRSQYQYRSRVNVEVKTAEDVVHVETAAWNLVERARDQAVPPAVDARLLWLAQGDGAAARAIVTAVEEAESVLLASSLRAELEQLLRLVAQGPVETVTHEVRLPAGDIHVTVRGGKRSRWMNDDRETRNLPVRQDDIVPAQTPRDIIEYALRQVLRPEDSQEIVRAAQQEALRLEVKRREGEMDAANAERELEQFVEHARQMSESSASFEMSADFRRATGTTRVTAKKRKWWFF